jgi:signal transduction histidine kinase
MIVFLLSVPLYAEEEDMEGEMAEAVLLLSKALATIKRDGPIEAFYKFNTKGGEFCYGELYVFVMSMDGIVFAQCADPSLVGLNMMEVQDAAPRREEKKSIGDAVKYALENGEGILEYDWWNPVNNQIESKYSFFKRVSPENFRVDFIVLVGFYTPIK